MSQLHSILQDIYLIVLVHMTLHVKVAKLSCFQVLQQLLLIKLDKVTVKMLPITFGYVAVLPLKVSRVEVKCNRLASTTSSYFLIYYGLIRYIEPRLPTKMMSV